QRRVTLGAAPLELTSREYAPLSDLVRRADQIVTPAGPLGHVWAAASRADQVAPRAGLRAHVWSTQFDPGSTLVEVHVSRLRDKLGRWASMIETVRGSGYRLRTRLDDGTAERA